MVLFAEKFDKKKEPERREETFGDRVLRLALSIPKGRVTTYGALAKAAGGGPVAARSVTSILGKAHDAGEKNIPFHRIVYSDGKVWMSGEYASKRLKLYKAEGIEIGKDGRIEDFADKLFEF